MIIYDENFNILGMGEKALDFLEFSSLTEFLENHKDVGEFVVGYDNKQSIIKHILTLSSHSKKVHIRSRSGKLLVIILKVNEISHKQANKLYELDLRLEDRIFDDEISTKDGATLSILRLPMIFSESKNKQNLKQKNIAINLEWLEQANLKLVLTRDEFLQYLKIFVQSANKIDIMLQNLITIHNYSTVRKIVAKLKEPAQNLHITPLIEIYNALLNANTAVYNDLLISARECINSLADLLQQQMDRK
ncbi:MULTISPECIES: hypothetical protein [unclassified Campylobacter]|uniref:hypothetical protein n=1 Tax=unclassified Campylobacter TaxID=2593542 RepID=UPI003D33E971